MFVVVEEIGPSFLPCAEVDAAVLAWLRGFALAKRMGKGFRGGFFIGGRFGGGGGWFGGRGKCGCAAVWPLETRSAGAVIPLGEEECRRSCEEEPWLTHLPM